MHFRDTERALNTHCRDDLFVYSNMPWSKSSIFDASVSGGLVVLIFVAGFQSFDVCTRLLSIIDVAVFVFSLLSIVVCAPVANMRRNCGGTFFGRHAAVTLFGRPIPACHIAGPSRCFEALDDGIIDNVPTIHVGAPVCLLLSIVVFVVVLSGVTFRIFVKTCSAVTRLIPTVFPIPFCRIRSTSDLRPISRYGSYQWSRTFEEPPAASHLEAAFVSHRRSTKT